MYDQPKIDDPILQRFHAALNELYGDLVDLLTKKAHASRIVPPACGSDGSGPRKIQSGARRNRKALLMTVTEERLIAALAIIGLSKRPKEG
jgi:hypothetical protein